MYPYESHEWNLYIELPNELYVPNASFVHLLHLRLVPRNGLLQERNTFQTLYNLVREMIGAYLMPLDLLLVMLNLVSVALL